jgi:hypothetical protein
MVPKLHLFASSGEKADAYTVGLFLEWQTMDKAQKSYDSSYNFVTKGLYPTKFVTLLEAPFGDPTDF